MDFCQSNGCNSVHIIVCSSSCELIFQLRALLLMKVCSFFKSCDAKFTSQEKTFLYTHMCVYIYIKMHICMCTSVCVT